MGNSNWYYYNHAMLPQKAPHEEADTSVILNKKIWKNPNKPLLARWTTDFDCKCETPWWYCIKDKSFDITKINAKKRYEINKGVKNFEVKKISAKEYVDEIFEVLKKAYSAYPEKYRPKIDKEQLELEVENWVKNNYCVLGAFEKETNILCGYVILIKNGRHIMFSVQKTDPEKEKLGINAALVYGVLNNFEEDLISGCYIVDGERNLVHETNFQNYLEKYFEFRKAYCCLNIAYRPIVKLIVKVIYPFRRLFMCLDSIGIIHQINGILKMEEVVRECNKIKLKGEHVK